MEEREEQIEASIHHFESRIRHLEQELHLLESAPPIAHPDSDPPLAVEASATDEPPPWSG